MMWRYLFHVPHKQNSILKVRQDLDEEIKRDHVSIAVYRKDQAISTNSSLHRCVKKRLNDLIVDFPQYLGNDQIPDILIDQLRLREAENPCYILVCALDYVKIVLATGYHDNSSLCVYAELAIMVVLNFFIHLY